MRRRVVLVVFLAMAAPATAVADVDLVVVHAPPTPSPALAAARAEVDARARDAGVPVLDVSPPAPAAAVAPERLRAGIDAYEELRFDDALAALDAAAAEAWRTGGAGLTAAQLSDVFLYRGLVHTQRGDATSAWDDLVRAATIAPARTLDPLRFPSRAVDAFERARTAVAGLPRATVEVDAPGCDAAIDGGAAARAELAHGEHVVRVVCPGGLAWGQRIVVDGDRLVRAPDDERAPPDDAAIAALTRGRGAGEALVVVLADGADGATAAVRVVTAAGRGSGRTIVTLPAEAADAAAAIADAIVARLAPPPPPPPPARARRAWWRAPWLWAAAGAAVTAAVLVPLALDGDDGGDTATVRPLGWSW